MLPSVGVLLFAGWLFIAITQQGMPTAFTADTHTHLTRLRDVLAFVMGCLYFVIAWRDVPSSTG